MEVNHILVDAREIERGFLFQRVNQHALMLGLQHPSHLRLQQRGLLLEQLIIKFFHTFEEPHAGAHDIILADIPLVLQCIDDFGLLVQVFEHFVAGHVVQPQDTVAHSVGFEDFDPPDLVGVVAVGTAAGFDIGVLDVDHTQVVARNDTTLVQTEAELFLGFGLIHEVFLDGVAL
jgi:hypothetical protein